jgi:signal transduction histidine kinase
MIRVQNQETFVEILRRSWLHLTDADSHEIRASSHSGVVSPSLSPSFEYQVTVEELQQQLQLLRQQNQELLRQQALSEQDSLGALGRIAKKLQHSLDETEMFQTVIQELVKVLNLVSCQVRLLNADGSMVLARHEYVPANEYEANAKVRRVDFPIETLEVGAVPQQFCRLIPPQESALTVLAYPLVDAVGTLGTMQLERYQPDWFSPADLEFVQQVAAQCAIALRRNRFAQINKTQAVELKHLNQLQDAFLGTVSYELRIPLANIRMAIQMITLALTKEAEPHAGGQPAMPSFLIADATVSKILRYLEVLQRECDRETKLIQDLLDLQQLDTDTLSIVLSAVDLGEWLPYVINPFQKRCQEYNLNLQYKIRSALPAFMCDQITLSRIVTELLGNATKYTPAGGQVSVTMEAVGKTAVGAQTLRIEVCNIGVEIPIEEQGKIFDKFYRIQKLDIRKLGGTGLGLALVDKLVQRLGGTVRLTSERQQTCFTVELPFQN